VPRVVAGGPHGTRIRPTNRHGRDPFPWTEGSRSVVEANGPRCRSTVAGTRLDSFPLRGTTGKGLRARSECPREGRDGPGEGGNSPEEGGRGPGRRQRAQGADSPWVSRRARGPEHESVSDRLGDQGGRGREGGSGGDVSPTSRQPGHPRLRDLD